MYAAGVAANEEVLEDFLRAASATIEELVTRALREGHPVWQLAIVLERKFDGEVGGGCGPRGAVTSRLASDPRLPPEVRSSLVEALGACGLDEVPVVMLVHGEGDIVCGVRRVKGGLVSIS